MRASTLAALVGSCTIVTAGTVVQSFGAFESERHAFSLEAWHAQRPVVEETADPGCILGPMAQDLVQTKRLLGLTKSQALQLLGSPSGQSKAALIYAIGQCHGWGWQHSELVLSMSAAEIIAGASVRKTE